MISASSILRTNICKVRLNQEKHRIRSAVYQLGKGVEIHLHMPVDIHPQTYLYFFQQQIGAAIAEAVSKPVILSFIRLLQNRYSIPQSRLTVFMVVLYGSDPVISATAFPSPGSIRDTFATLLEESTAA